jgi:site-specific recombinase XerD
MADLVDSLASVRDYLAAEKAPATRRAYAADFADFSAWCEHGDHAALPADPLIVARYLASLADRKMKASTIVRRCAAIKYAHRMKGFEPPTSAEGVKAVIRGIRRKIGTAQSRKAPATARAITSMIADAPDTLAGKRDRAILLIGFAAALRRSEIVALNAEDVELAPEGVRIHVRRSKTDQEAEGYVISVPQGTKLRPLQALREWLDASGISEGPLFRAIGKGGRLLPGRLTDQSVAAIVKKCARRAGLDATTFSGHSLRAGFVTSALESGADLLNVMDVTRHKKVDSLKVYDRRARGFKSHAGKAFL